jgi:hypothetical protein
MARFNIFRDISLVYTPRKFYGAPKWKTSFRWLQLKFIYFNDFVQHIVPNNTRCCKKNKIQKIPANKLIFLQKIPTLRHIPLEFNFFTALLMKIRALT